MSDIEKNKEHISTELHRGLVGKWRRCIGLHGTSVETLVFAIDNGYIPGATVNTYDDWYLPQRHDLYYSPYLTRRVLNLYRVQAKDFMRGYTPYEDALFYAGYTAKIHYVLANLGLNLGDIDAYKAAVELLDSEKRVGRNDPINLISREYTKDKIKQVLIGAKKVRGVIFGVDKRALDRYTDDFGDPGEPDRRLRTETGFAIEYIRGLRVLDSTSNNVLLRRLRE